MQNGLHIGLAAWIHKQRDTASFTVYPNLPVSVSLTGMHLIEGYTDATGSPAKFAQQQQALAQATAASDLFCLSLHSFISALLADQVADMDLLDQIFSLGARPVAVCETSYPAQTFELSGLTWNGRSYGLPDCRGRGWAAPTCALPICPARTSMGRTWPEPSWKGRTCSRPT